MSLQRRRKICITKNEQRRREKSLLINKNIFVDLSNAVS